jgi:hypothetical protein
MTVLLILLLFQQNSEAAGYPAVPISKIAAGGWPRPRAEITGIVTYVRKEEDGDWHYRVSDGKNFVVCEEIPELRMPNGHPRVGDTVVVRGVVRYDGDHKWWELHPVVWWRKVP